MLTIELRRDNSIEGLGFTVAGYRTADGRSVSMLINFYEAHLDSNL